MAPDHILQSDLFHQVQALSAQEVAQGYKDVKERSAIVRFKVIGEDAYFLAWTTTPWTLPSKSFPLYVSKIS